MGKIYLKIGILLSITAFVACKKDNAIGGSDANFKPSGSFGISFTDESHLTAKFSDSSYNAGSYFWDFGDGSSSTEQNPTHTYTDSSKGKQYTVTRVVISKIGGYRDTLKDDIKVYSATPKIYKVEDYRGESYNGEYRITLSMDYQYAKKVDFYLKKDNGDVLLHSIQPNYSFSYNRYYGNNSPLKIGSFDAATANQTYKLKIVYIGSTGITKDTTINIFPKITKIIIEKISLITISGMKPWDIPTNPLNLAVGKNEFNQVDSAKTKKNLPYDWILNKVYDSNDPTYRLIEEDGTNDDPDHSKAIDLVDFDFRLSNFFYTPPTLLLTTYSKPFTNITYTALNSITILVFYHYE